MAGHLIDNSEIINFNLQEVWKSPNKSREQKTVLLKFFCGLDDMESIERFLAYFRSFDDTLMYARFPALQKEYLKLMDKMAEDLNKKLKGTVAKFAVLMKTSLKRFMEKENKNYPIPPADTLDWSYLINRFKEDLQSELINNGQLEWQKISEREPLTNKEQKEIKNPNPYPQDLINLLEGDKQFGIKELQKDEEDFKHAHEQMLQKCTNHALSRSFAILDKNKLKTLLNEKEDEVVNDVEFDFDEYSSVSSILFENNNLNSTVIGEAPNTSSGCNVMENSPLQPRNDILITRNVKHLSFFPLICPI